MSGQNTITSEEREMIDKAISDGMVTHCPVAKGLTQQDFVWCPKARRLVYVDKQLAKSFFRGGSTANEEWKLKMDRMNKRRSAVSVHMAMGLSVEQIAAKMDKVVALIKEDVRVLSARALEKMSNA